MFLFMKLTVVCCCHGDRLPGNMTANDVVVTSLIYMNLTSLETYLTVMLELTVVCLSLCDSIFLMYVNFHLMMAAGRS